jgi:heavy metal sensor kinase
MATAPRVWRLLAFRLTVYYGGVLAVAAGATFGLGYAIVTSAMRSRTDADLVREADRCADAYRTAGPTGLAARIEADARAIGTNDIFFRWWNGRGESALTSDLSGWSDAHLPNPRPGSPVDASGAGHHSRLRVLAVPVGPGLLQVGVTVQDDQRVVDEVRRLGGLVLLALVAVAVPVGWVLARRALAGVARVTQTANDISGGALGHRVPLSGSGDEVDQLAATFNRMLERIQTVVEGMEETNDNIAHELRSPVTRIRGLAETTLTGRADIGDYQSMAASTIDECDRLLAMINTMLDIAEAEAGVMSLNRGPVDVSGLLREVAELFEPVAAERAVHVLVAPSGEAVRALGDEHRLQRVVANLMDNAIKYADLGGTVTLSVAGDGRSATVAVTNTGPGIGPDDLPNVFKRFYRADRGRAGRGNGLGLSLAQAIVQAHGGQITVDSRPGGPTTFAFALPVEPAHGEQRPA